MRKPNRLNIDLPNSKNIYKNIAQDYIFTTKDKLELVLIKTKDCWAKKNMWITSGGLFVTFLTALGTADFKDKFLPASVWEFLFMMGTAGCFIWFVCSLVIRIKNRNKCSIDYVINKIISESKE